MSLWSHSPTNLGTWYILVPCLQVALPARGAVIAKAGALHPALNRSFGAVDDLFRESSIFSLSQSSWILQAFPNKKTLGSRQRQKEKRRPRRKQRLRLWQSQKQELLEVLSKQPWRQIRKQRLRCQLVDHEKPVDGNQKSGKLTSWYGTKIPIIYRVWDHPRMVFSVIYSINSISSKCGTGFNCWRLLQPKNLPMWQRNWRKPKARIARSIYRSIQLLSALVKQK